MGNNFEPEHTPHTPGRGDGPRAAGRQVLYPTSGGSTCMNDEEMSRSQTADQSTACVRDIEHQQQHDFHDDTLH